LQERNLRYKVRENLLRKIIQYSNSPKCRKDLDIQVLEVQGMRKGRKLSNSLLTYRRREDREAAKSSQRKHIPLKKTQQIKSSQQNQTSTKTLKIPAGMELYISSPENKHY